MSYKQAMKWHKKHPKGIRNLYFGFDCSTKPKPKTIAEIIEFYPEYLAFHKKNKSKEKGNNVCCLCEYIEWQLKNQK